MICLTLFGFRNFIPSIAHKQIYNKKDEQKMKGTKSHSQISGDAITSGD